MTLIKEKMEDHIIFLEMEDNLNFEKIEDDLNHFVNGRQPHFFLKWNNSILFVKGRQPYFLMETNLNL
jgi:hypothetical protein